MKKTYLVPTIKVQTVAMRHHIASGTSPSFGSFEAGTLNSGPGLRDDEWDPEAQGDALGHSIWDDTCGDGFNW